MPSLPLSQAARELGKSAETLRRWVREEGCPAIQGGRGRGKGARVDPRAVRAWLASRGGASREGAAMHELAAIALDFFRRGREIGELGQCLLGIPDAKAAALLCFFLDYAARRVLQAELRTRETDLLAAIALQGSENVHAMTDSVKQLAQP